MWCHGKWREGSWAERSRRTDLGSTGYRRKGESANRGWRWDHALHRSVSKKAREGRQDESVDQLVVVTLFDFQDGLEQSEIGKEGRAKRSFGKCMCGECWVQQGKNEARG